MHMWHTIVDVRVDYIEVMNVMEIVYSAHCATTLLGFLKQLFIMAIV